MKRKLLFAALCVVSALGFKANASVTLETDLTSQFSALTDYTKWIGATGFTSTDYCPMVTVGGGIGQKQVCEKYETTCATTGDIFYQTVSGLAAGTYTIELYGGAAFCYGRGFGSQAFTGEITTGDAWGTHTSTTYTDGQHIDTETGVFLYATTSEREYKLEIPIYYAGNFPDGAATVTLKDVVVGTNGQVKIGMNKTSQSTNWHVIQLKSVIATVDGATAISNLKTTANALLNNATYTNVTGSERTNLQSAYDATPAEETQEAYEAVISALNTAISAFEGCDYAAYNSYAIEKEKALALGMTGETVNATAPANAVAAATATQSLKVAEYNYVKNNYAYGVELGSWTTTGETATNSGQHWDGTTTSTYLEQRNGNENGVKYGWEADSWSIGYTQDVLLPAGNYVFKVAGRRSSDAVNLSLTVKNGETVLGSVNDFPMGDTGKGIDINGATNFGDGTYANNGTGRGFEWRYVKFTLSEPATVNVAVTAVASAIHQWMSFCNPTVQTDKEDNVDIMEALVALNNAKTAATLTQHTNVGTGVFQLESATDASLWSAYDTAKSNAEAFTLTAESTTESVTALTTALTTAQENYYNNQVLVAPTAGARYYLEVATSGHAKENSAIVVSLGTTNDNNKTGYGFAANASPAAHVAGAYIFTPVEGKVNIYNISVERPEGIVYLTYGSLNNSAAGWATQQIQGTTDESAKGEFKIVATSNANVFNIVNTVFDGADNYIDCQDGGALYTDTNIDTKDFKLAEASQATVEVKVDADKFATRIFPFAPGAIDGITFYTATVAGEKVELEEVETPEANVPYILKASNDVNTSVSGWGTATADSYTEGALTGVYTAATIAAGANNYVLQTQGGIQAFYKVDAAFTATAYRAYLTAEAAGEVKALYFDFGGETAIKGVEAADMQNATIYNLAGQRVNKAQKGIYIVNGKKVAVK